MLEEAAVPTLEERVAYLEGQVSEHTHTLIEIRDAIRQLDQRFDARFEQVDRRFEQVDRRFEQLERRFDTRFDVYDRRLEGLDEKVSRQFTWVVGIQVTTLIAIVGALLAFSASV
jgi:predicted RNase H-like nuclease (RuvC/YqgF family)